MKFPRTPRPLPIGLRPLNTRLEAVASVDRQIIEMFEAQPYNPALPEMDAAMRRLIVLQAQLCRADAEIRFTGRAETLSKTQRSVAQIATMFDIRLRARYLLPKVGNDPLMRLPVILGAHQPESEYEAVNKVRVELDGLYQDLPASLGHDRAAVALLWYSLPRAEAEIDFFARMRTLERIHTVAEEIAARVGVALVDLDGELVAVSPNNSPMAA